MPIDPLTIYGDKLFFEGQGDRVSPRDEETRNSINGQHHHDGIDLAAEIDFHVREVEYDGRKEQYGGIEKGDRSIHLESAAQADQSQNREQSAEGDVDGVVGFLCQVIRTETPEMGPNKNKAADGDDRVPTMMSVDEGIGFLLAFVHVGKFADLLESLPLGIVVPGTDLVGQGRAHGCGQPVGSVSIIADQHFQPHGVTEGNEAVSYFIVANEPRCYRDNKCERSYRERQEPALSLLQ